MFRYDSHDYVILHCKGILHIIKFTNQLTLSHLKAESFCQLVEEIKKIPSVIRLRCTLAG